MTNYLTGQIQRPGRRPEDIRIVTREEPNKVVPTVASAAAFTVPVGESIVIVSGTTNITSLPINDGHEGSTVTLIFQDVLTFTDGSNLVLAGNFSTSADDTITLVCDGTNWYETSRSAN